MTQGASRARSREAAGVRLGEAENPLVGRCEVGAPYLKIEISFSTFVANDLDLNVRFSVPGGVPSQNVFANLRSPDFP